MCFLSHSPAKCILVLKMSHLQNVNVNVLNVPNHLNQTRIYEQLI